MLDFIGTETIAALVGVIVGALITFGGTRIRNWRNRGWHVVLRHDGEALLRRPISPQRVQEVHGDSTDLAVFAKHVISPYGRLQCDPVETVGLVEISEATRQIVIDVSRDPNFQPSEHLLRIEQL